MDAAVPGGHICFTVEPKSVALFRQCSSRTPRVRTDRLTGIAYWTSLLSVRLYTPFL